MDPLVKAHLRIAALEQQLRELPPPADHPITRYYNAHRSRVIPVPGDIIKCQDMDEPMRVLQTYFHTAIEVSTAVKVYGYLVSDVPGRDDRHRCRDSTCMDTIKIQSRTQSDFEKTLLDLEYLRGVSNGSTG